MPLDIENILPQVQKPARYSGGELGSVMKDVKDVFIRFAFCFPDLYEVGMSHLGMKILYGLYNREADTWCERVFAPDKDMEQQMAAHNIPLFALESRDPVKMFDFVGFTLQYEMCYPTVLH
ncbi:MAG: B12-binding domain-containing radical SAM protein, partial [Clostridia bacterium]|nr:B12-binding domain-containing radical SAM protein [Clostridia bacterium]